MSKPARRPRGLTPGRCVRLPATCGMSGDEPQACRRLARGGKVPPARMPPGRASPGTAMELSAVAAYVLRSLRDHPDLRLPEAMAADPASDRTIEVQAVRRGLAELEARVSRKTEPVAAGGSRTPRFDRSHRRHADPERGSESQPGGNSRSATGRPSSRTSTAASRTPPSSRPRSSSSRIRSTGRRRSGCRSTASPTRTATTRSRSASVDTAGASQRCCGTTSTSPAESW